MRPMILFAVAAAIAFAGCESPQTLHFVEDAALMPALRIDCDFRYHVKQGWELPTAPGTPEADIKSGAVPEAPKSSGIGFRLFGDFSFRQVKDQDEILAGNTAVVNNETINPGLVQSNLDFKREDVGFRFLFFSSSFGFTGGIGMFVSAHQMTGSIGTLTDRVDALIQTYGLGGDVLFEVCPGFQPIRLYAHFSAWSAFEGPGYLQGSDSEFGIKGTWRGLSLFGGYRIENFHGKVLHNPWESLLVFEVRGPIFGIGITF